MWPPVPPAAIRIRIVPRAPVLRLARYREEDTHGGERDDQRRPAGADERERDAGQRDELQHDRDVDERLERQPGRDAHRQKTAEGIGSTERDLDAAIGEE